MIAASEPQEFIPSGRQLILKHPGLPKNTHDDSCLDNRGLDAFVLHRLKHVSLTEENALEWWIVREDMSCSEIYGSIQRKTEEGYFQLDKKIDDDKSYFNTQETNFNESLSWKTIDPSIGKTPSRISDTNIPKLSINKSRFSGEVDFYKNESKTSYNANKSCSSINNANLKLNTSICKKELNLIEEELYIKGCTAVWSKGLLSSNSKSNTSGTSRITLCSYTMENPIKHALWCTFYLERPSFIDVNAEVASRLEKPTGKPLSCICLVSNCNMNVFTANSEDFIVSLPFQVSNIWSTKFGLLIEKEISNINYSFNKSNTSVPDYDSTFANIYSLAHPLDEFCPVALKNATIQLLNNPSIKIIFVSIEPSICFVYDANVGLHCVYQLRKIKVEEWIEMSVSKIKLCSTMPSPASISSKVKNNLSVWSGQGAGLPLATGSPYSSRAASLSNLVSPYNSRSQSPMATISRCQSPSISPFVSGGGWINRSSYLHNEEASMNTYGASQMDISMQQKEANPDICLEHTWTETVSTMKANFGVTTGPASKAFLTSDLVGQNYLCYLVPTRNQLVLIRMDLSNDNNLIFGTSYCISAKDAVCVPSLHMIAIVEPNGLIILYSGPTTIGKLHIGGVSAEFTSCVTQNLNVPTNFKSPFPRRSSLLPHCVTPASVIQFDENFISPVNPAGSSKENRQTNVLHSTLLNEPFVSGNMSNSITALRDPVCDRITLQYSDNTYFRVSLPPLASGILVSSCLNALRQSLQKDVAITLFSKWYAMRNAPGPVDLTVEQEWHIFTSLLYNLLGYDVEKLKSTVSETYSIADEAKRQRPSPQGRTADWEKMFNSEQHKEISENLGTILNLQKLKTQTSNSKLPEKGQINTNSPLFTYFRLILFSLHLLYEEFKLNTIFIGELPFLAKFLHQLAFDLRLYNYVVHYWKDYPNVCQFHLNANLSQISDVDMLKISPLLIMDVEPLNIMQHFCNLLSGYVSKPYPYIKHVNPSSKNLLQICGIVASGRFEKSDFDINNLIKVFAPPGSRVEPQISSERSIYSYNKLAWAEKVVMFMTENGMTRQSLDNIPVALNLVLHEALWQCRENPPTDWPADSYYLLQRPDLAYQAEENNQKTSEKEPSGNILSKKYLDTEQDDGMEDVDSPLLKLRFPDDHRIAEVRSLLQSSEPVHIGVTQRPDVSDHDFIEEQEKHLYAICTRTMALPVGRGMFTMRSATPVVTEPLPVPRLCLTGKAPPRGATVELSHIDTPPNMNLWPLFHNGVAAGLRIITDASNIDSTWIVFNKPKSTAETPMEHAGFLMALGLNGHLKNLAVMNMYEYLIQFREMTSVGLLLGIAATKRGTMDTSTTKMLSIHIEALLPPTSMELDIPQNIQVAALLGIGLVYQGSAHRHITEVLLSEIGRPPGPEMENSVDRESYSLAAGLALGLVTLKQGGQPSGFADLGVPDTLHYYMVGGNKRLLTGSQKDKYKVPSFQIREGSTVNLDVTAPGATLALGLMYLGSGNRAIADWMKPPDTQYLLDFVRPDFLMLRIISKALILWDDIQTTKDWVNQQIPEAIRPFCLDKPTADLDTDIDYESMNQAYCNIVAGACFAMGLRFAGTADENAFQTLYNYCRMFTSLTGKTIAELAGKPTIETCLNLILLSLGMVMAGTGRLEVLRLCRHLRKRVGVASSTVVTYGSHLAIHMALGLLFLGGGRYTLSNSPPSVAAMLCAFFPKFPTHSNDNRYHLQAFRHLYVLAVEPRLIIPRDALTGKMCYANLAMVKLDGSISSIKAPCLVPDLSTLARVSVQDERYWPIVFERGRNWEQLHLILQSSGQVRVKQRAGCLSYLEDPFGMRSLLARSLTQSSTVPWAPLPNAISSFSSEPTVKYFTDYFLTPKFCSENNIQEQSFRQAITMAMYECVTKDKLAILPIWIVFIKIVQNLDLFPKTSHIWQLKILFAQVLSHHNRKALISSEVVLSMKQQTEQILEKWQNNLNQSLKAYLSGSEINLSIAHQLKTANFVTYFDIPFNINVGLSENYLEMIKEFQNSGLNYDYINKIVDILSH